MEKTQKGSCQADACGEIQPVRGLNVPVCEVFPHINVRLISPEPTLILHFLKACLI